MDEIMDTKVVQMKFDNSQFRSGVEDTIKQLANLENSLEMQGASKGLDNVAKASKETSKAINVVGESVESVHLAFSYLEVAGITAMVKLTNAALNYGKKIANNLWSRSIGQVISGGKRRSQNISNAKFQLEGLGVAWDDIVDDINYGVKDTAYGLDEAATAASQLVASQVQLGTEMKTALRGISGTAAMTNSTFSEISNIFTTVASNGRLMTMQLRQLSARGLNASATIAKYYREVVGEANMTEEAINQMVTRGEIDFRRFADAMDWAFGDHAKEANKTFQGALSNMNAALSRIGQKFADPVFENFRKIFIALTGDIDAVNKALQPAMDAFSVILGDAERIVEKFLTSEHFVKGLIALAVDVWTWVRTLIIAVQEFAGAGVYIDNFTRPFESLARAMQLYGDKADYVKNIIKDVLAVFDIFIHGIKSALTILKPFAEALLEGIGIPLEKIKEDFDPGWLYEHKEAFKAVMDVIAKFIAMKLANIIRDIAAAIRAIDWKMVLKAVVIIVNVTAKAITLIPDLIRLVQAVFTVAVKSIMAAVVAIVWFKNEVLEAIKIVGQVLYTGFSALFGGFNPTISINADTSSVKESANETMQSVKNSTEEATNSVDELNSSIEETSDRMENSVKTVERSTEKFSRSYDSAAESAEEAATRVERANDRIEVASKGFELPDRNDPRNTLFPSNDQTQSQEVSGADLNKLLKPLHESQGSGEEALEKSGISGIINTLAVYAGLIENDTEGQKKVVSAFDVWFGGIADAIKSNAAVWFAKISLAIQTILPIVLLLAVAIARIKMAITVAKTIGAVLNAVIGIIKGIGDFFKSFGYFAKALYKNAVANELRAVAELVRSLVGPILAIAAAFAVFVAAAYVIKKFELEDVIDILMKQLKSILIIIGIMMAISAVITKYQTINKVMQNLLNITAIISKTIKGPGIFRAKSTAEGVIKNLALMFFALAIDLAVLAASIKLLGEMDLLSLSRGIGSLMLITGILMLLIVAVGAFANAFRTYTYSYEELTGALSKSPFSRDKGVESKNNEMYKTLMALAGVIAIMTAAVVILGKQDIDTLLKGGVVVIVAMSALFGFLALIMRMAKSYESHTDYADNNKGLIKDIKKGPAESATIKSVIGLIAGLAGFMLAISSVMRSAKNLDAGQLGVVTAIIAASLGALTGLMAVIAWNARQATEVPSKQIKSVYTGMALTIAAVSIFMLSISASLRMLSGLSGEDLTAGWVILMLSLGGLAAFIAGVSYLIKKYNMTSEVVVLAGSMMAMSVGLSILIFSIAGMFTILQQIDWSAMEGSAGYLIGAGVFVAAMVGLILALTVVAKGNYGPIIAASIGIFGGISLMLWALSNTFTVLGSIDWSSVKDAQGVLLILLGAIVLIGVLCTVIAALGPEVSGPAIAAVLAMSGLFMSMAAMFAAIGICVSLIGSGVLKVATAVDTIINVPWERAGIATEGISDLIRALSRLASTMDFNLLSGAIIFSGFVLLMSAALNMLAGIDQSAVKSAGEALNQFFSSMAENLDEKEMVVNFLVGLAAMLPFIAQAIAASIIILAIGGIGLLAFAFEMIIFAALMQQVGNQIVPAMETFVNAIVGCGDVIFSKGLELLAGFAAIFAVATLSIVVGTLLTVGGGLMAAGAGLIYLAGKTLEKGIESVVSAIGKSGKIILSNAADLMIGVHMLAAFGVTMSVVGVVLAVSGTLFATGSAVMLGASKLFGKAVSSFGHASVSMGIYANTTVMYFRSMVQGLYQLAKESQGLGAAFAWAANMIVIGFLEGLASGAPLIDEAIVNLATSVITSFKETLGIASPSTEMIEAAFWTIEGFIKGLVDNAPSLQNVCTDIVEGVVNIFSGGSDSIAAEGAEAGVGFVSNVSDVFSIAGPDVQSMLDDIGFAWGDGLGDGMEQGFKRHVQNLINYENELASHIGPANWLPWQYSQYLREVQNGADYRSIQAMVDDFNADAENRARHEGLICQIPTYTPLSTLGLGTDYIDVDEIYRNLGGSSGGGGGYTSDMAAAISGSSGAGSGINDQSKAASIGGGVGNTITNSNNTYNFYQNNYSPEPLNRSAIYQLTRQQLNGFYAYVKEKNLSY